MKRITHPEYVVGGANDAPLLENDTQANASNAWWQLGDVRVMDALSVTWVWGQVSGATSWLVNRTSNLLAFEFWNPFK